MSEIDKLKDDLYSTNIRLFGAENAVFAFRQEIKRLKQKLKEIKTISNTYKGIKEMDEITRIINRRR